jgi:hypothetical protein
LNRGISVVDTVRILKGDAVTEDDIFKATVLGWLIEFVSAFVDFECEAYFVYLFVYGSFKLSSWFLMILWMLPSHVVDSLVGTSQKVLVWLLSTMLSFLNLVSIFF